MALLFIAAVGSVVATKKDDATNGVEIRGLKGIEIEKVRIGPQK